MPLQNNVPILEMFPFKQMLSEFVTSQPLQPSSYSFVVQKSATVTPSSTSSTSVVSLLVNCVVFVNQLPIFRVDIRHFSIEKH